jgi:hypothetical protein
MRESSYRNATLWFGVIMTVIGILGFITQGTTNGNHLFGLFYVDTAFNVIFTVTGVLGMLAAAGSHRVVRTYFRAVTVVYALWAIIGLFSGSGQVLGFINNNGWDVALNAIVAIAAAGYGWSEVRAGEREAMPAGRRGDAVAFGEYQDEDRDR